MSTIIATTLSNGSVSVPTATVVNGSAKSWVNFNGSGTIAARDSFNFSSLTDNATGNYTVSITNAMADANYVVLLTAGNDTIGFMNIASQYFGNLNTTTTMQFLTAQGTDTNSADATRVYVAFLGDLA